MRKLMLAGLIAVLVVPAALAAGPVDQTVKNARVACTSLKARMGTDAFVKAYGGFEPCVRSLVKVEQQNVAAAQSACTAEQADANFAAGHGGQTFAQVYGAGKSGRNAYDRCVALKAGASSLAEVQGRLSPAQTCSAQRAQVGASTFLMLYRQSHRTAAAVCLSQVAKAQLANELSAATSCRSEQADANFAAAHGGKTFGQYYGTNANRSNAFGKCVSSKASATSNAQSQATIAAAKSCRTEYDAGATAFNQKYGSFTTCVSQKI